MQKHMVGLAFSAALVLSTACGSSRLTSVWVAPEGGAAAKHVLVVAIRNDQTRRRVWEDAFVQGLKARGVAAEPSYILSPRTAPTEAELREKLPGSGYDAVLVLRYVGKREDSFYVPPRAQGRPFRGRYGRFYPSYGTMYARIYEPGYVETQRISTFESSLWLTAGEGELVWSAHSETRDPASAAELSEEQSKVVLKAMARDGVI